MLPSPGSPAEPNTSALFSALSTFGAAPPQHLPHHHHHYHAFLQDQQQRQQDQQRVAFQALRPVTTQLLVLRDQPDRLQPQLLDLRRLLETLPASDIASCWDYVAFPLLILLDSVVPSRRRVRQGPGSGSVGAGGAAAPADGAAGPGGGAGAEGPAAKGDVVAPACRSDRVVEALLGTLQVLLERSPGPGPGPAPGGQHEPGRGQGHDPMHPPPADTQLAALQRLAPLLQLPRDSTSEEVHLALQRCLQAAMRPLAAAAEAWAAAAAEATRRDGAMGRGSGPHMLSTREQKAGAAGGRVGSGEGGGGGGGAGVSAPVFCGEEAASLAGYLVHCCMEVAEGEVLLGHRGSKSLCAAALTSLGLLVTAMPDPDTLAFFLPGIVSGLSKHLFAAGTAAAISGPSAPPGAAATVQALVCLRAAIITVLSDEATSAILGDLPYVSGGGPGGDAGGGGGSPALPAAKVHKAEDALSALKALSVASSSAAAATAAAGGAGTAAAPPAGAVTALAPDGAAGQQQQRQQEQQQQQRRRLRVDRTLSWLEETSGRIKSLLGRALPPLASHPRPAVRGELASTCAALLDRSGRSLAPSQPLLLRLLFTLAQDEWQQVAAPCRVWVARRAAELECTKATAAAVTDGNAADSASGADSGEGGDGRRGGGGEAGGAGAGAHSDSVLSSRRGSGGGGQRTAELKALEDEFERFMQGLMSDSALLEPPTLELDERELYGGTDDAAGGRDQDQDPAAAVVVAAPSSATTGAAATQAAAPLPVATTAAAVHEATGERRGGPPPPPPSLPSPPKPALPPALPGLQHLIAAMATSRHLLGAVRAGEVEAVVQARCLTTALLVAGPGRAVEWLLLRPAALSDLLAGLFRCFAFDRNAAPLVLHLRGEAGAYAPAVTMSATPTSTAAGPPPGAQLQTHPVAQPPASARQAQPPLPGTLGPAGAGAAGEAGPGGAASTARAAAAVLAAAATELPRMPMGLLYLASQRSYAAVAAVARTLGWLARAADVQAAAAATGTSQDGAVGSGSGTGSSFAFDFYSSSCSISSFSGVLRRLMDELTGALRAAERRKPPPRPDSGDSGSVGSAWAAVDQEEEGEAEEQVGCSPSLAGVADKSSWQCEAAAVVAVLAEVVIGGSNAWVPPLEQPAAAAAPGEIAGQPPAEEPACSGAVSSASGAFPAADPAYEAVLLSVLQELMRPALLKLSTHNSNVDGATAGGGGTVPISYDNVVHSELAAAAARQPLSAQALGENVMLLRGVLEAVGTAARAAGPRFASQGRLLRTVLVPLLELLGDPQPSVAASADAALRSICAHCGYGGSLTALLGANADYVVDAMCTRLRDLQRHPRAPHLLAALLRRAGVAPQLLPLMAEPLQRALQGLSVLARHWAPHYAHSYLAALKELAMGSAAEAEAAAADSRAAVAELNRLAAEARDREEQRSAAAAAAAAASDREAPVAGGTAAAATAAAAAGPGDHEEVRRYFMGRAAAGAHQGADKGGAADTRGGGGGTEDAAREDGPGGGYSGDDRPLLRLTAGQLEEGELRFRRLHAAAVVAGAAADAATPLLLSSNLRAAIAASEVLRGALAALAASTPAVEAEATAVEEYGGVEARMRPVRPETPKVLPVVAAAWGPLMAALRDARTPVVERGVAAVAELVAVSGGKFLARRFQQEAWPVLQRLLASGTAHTPGMLSLGTDAVRAAASAAALGRRGRLLASQGGGGAADGIWRGGEDAGGALAPAAVIRVRVAVLGCLEAVCRCRDATAAVRTLTWDIAQAALPFLGLSHPPQLHEAAQATLLAVAALDPDSVWLLLYDTSYNMPPSLPAPAARVPDPGQQTAPRRSEARGQAPQPQQLFQGRQQKQLVTDPVGVVVDRNRTAPGPSFPPLRALLPPLPGSGAGGSTSRRGGLASSGAGSGQLWAVTSGIAADCGPRAQALLGVVAGCPVPWHVTPVPQVPLDVV